MNVEITESTNKRKQLDEIEKLEIRNILVNNKNVLNNQFDFRTLVSDAALTGHIIRLTFIKINVFHFFFVATY